MLKLFCTGNFLKQSKKLPVSIQKKLARQLEILKENPFNSLLHSKPLAGSLAGLYSFRITRDWRVIFYFLNEWTVKIVDVAHRKDIYK